MSGHVTTLLNSCASVLYALRTLRAHGMRQDCLHEVFRSTVLAKLLYASPAWSDFCSAGDINKTRQIPQQMQISQLLQPDDFTHC